MTEKEEKLLNAFYEAEEMLENIGIEHGEISELQINTRAKHRWGQCKYNMLTNTFFISISSRLLNDGVEKKALFDTLIHELLHTCGDGGECMEHTGMWLKLANKVNQHYPELNIKRITSSEEKGLEPVKRTYRPIKYFLKCPNCGKIYARKKMTYAIKNAERCGCSKCGNWGLELIENDIDKIRAQWLIQAAHSIAGNK